MDSFMSKRNWYIQLVKVLHCKLPTIGKELPTFPHRTGGLNLRAQRWKASVLPQCHHYSLQCDEGRKKREKMHYKVYLNF